MAARISPSCRTSSRAPRLRSCSSPSTCSISTAGTSGSCRLSSARRQLKKIIAGSDVQFSESFEIDGREMFTHACKVGLEGVVSRCVTASTRRPARNNWVKKTCAQRETLTIAGFALDERQMGRSSISQAAKGDDLIYAGKVDHWLRQDIGGRAAAAPRAAGPEDTALCQADCAQRHLGRTEAACGDRVPSQVGRGKGAASVLQGAARGPVTARRSAAKFFQPPLETKTGFANFFVATGRWRPGASWARAKRRAPVVSGAARNHLALWRIWLCALTISRPSGARPLVSTAFSTSRKSPSGPARTTIRPTTSNGWPRTAIRFRWRLRVLRPTISSITAEQNVVTIEGSKSEKAERDFLYRGISTRNFKRQFNLAEYVQVKSAAFDNGLLKIELVREIPEAMKPRRIAINGAARPTTCRSWKPRPPRCRRHRRRASKSRGCRHSSMKGGDHAADDRRRQRFDFNALLHPGTVFEHPRDVVDHTGLTMAEKRAILASWASDASAIASCPSMRSPAGLKKPVSIDEILEALCELDGGPRMPPAESPTVCVRPNVRPRREVRSLR